MKSITASGVKNRIERPSFIDWRKNVEEISMSGVSVIATEGCSRSAEL